MNGVVMAETLRRHATNPGVILYFLFMAFMSVAAADWTAPGHAWRPLLTLFIVITAAQLIGPEFTTGTLQLVLARPINRSTYLLSRTVGVVFVIWIAIWMLIATESVAKAPADGSRALYRLYHLPVLFLFEDFLLQRLHSDDPGRPAARADADALALESAAACPEKGSSG